jgi:glycosyltransferase involved in cell wall biosynthesis
VSFQDSSGRENGQRSPDITPARTDNPVVGVVCAYNEASFLDEVLRVLVACPELTEVIVVDDGSTDATSDVVERDFPEVRLIRHGTNAGKGRAMRTGVEAAPHASVIFFCDADMRGMTHEMIDAVVQPVRRGLADMVVAQRPSVFYHLPWIFSLAPKLSGVRAVRRSVWNRVPDIYKRRFQIEAALNYFAAQKGTMWCIVVDGLNQVIKERKYGLVKGFVARLRMCFEIVHAMLRLRAGAPLYSMRSFLTWTRYGSRQRQTRRPSKRLAQDGPL